MDIRLRIKEIEVIMEDSKILNVNQVKEILDREPGAEFSLQRIRMEFQGGGSMMAGYHIYLGYLPRMHHVKGREIWEYVKEP